MIARLVIDPAQAGAAEARWTATVLLSLTGCAWREGSAGEGPVVYVGPASRAPEGAAVVLPWLESFDWTPATLALAYFEGVPVPCPVGTLAAPADAHSFPAEWLRAVFFLLSREEERVDRARDQWECFAGTQSSQDALGVLERPLVNECAALLASRLKVWAAAHDAQLAPLPLWPNGKRYAAMLSHDVDEVRFGSLVEAARLLALTSGPRSYALRAGLTQAARGFVEWGRTDPYWNFERWVAAEELHGFRSSFYFCAPAPAHRHEYDARYRFVDRIDYAGTRGTVAELLARLAGRGFDVGLHGSYLSHKDADDLAQQRAQIEASSGAPVPGTRQHFLRFDIARTWRAQEDAGFAYDSTLGYNEAIGFRAGIAAPFTPWDAGAGRPHRLIELPLTVMDGTLFRTYGLDGMQAAARVEKHLHAVEATGGLAVLLWHPNGAAEKHFPGWWAAWEATLQRLASTGAWVATGREIAAHWQERMRGTALPA